MKKELSKRLEPLFVQLEEAGIDKRRIYQAEQDCIKKRGLNGCWNCDVDEDKCPISETKRMIQARVHLTHLNIVNKVKEWLDVE